MRHSLFHECFEQPLWLPEDEGTTQLNARIQLLSLCQYIYPCFSKPAEIIPGGVCLVCCTQCYSNWPQRTINCNQNAAAVDSALLAPCRQQGDRRMARGLSIQRSAGSQLASQDEVEQSKTMNSSGSCSSRWGRLTHQGVWSRPELALHYLSGSRMWPWNFN